MRSKRGQKGAISVFLSIILVPCIVVSSVFVDLGRVHLSKTMAESSADLALNSLLTNYDADLKDWYGMVASCQNIQEFYEVSAQYFLRTISSQNLSSQTLELVKYHHQNLKHSGYPALNNTKISSSIGIQIVSISDKYSALREARVYRKRLSRLDALLILYREVREGKILPEVYNALVKYAEKFDK